MLFKLLCSCLATIQYQFLPILCLLPILAYIFIKCLQRRFYKMIPNEFSIFRRIFSNDYLNYRLILRQGLLKITKTRYIDSFMRNLLKLFKNRNPQEQRHIQKQGLPNIGNSCYIASVLQALFSIEPFMQNLIKLFELKYPKGVICKSLTHWFIQIYNASHSTEYDLIILIKNFKNCFVRKYGSFSGSTQQDAQEFLHLLLDCIHTEMKNQLNYDNYGRVEINCNKSFQLKYQQYCNSINYQRSVVFDYFGGDILNTYQCQNCQYSKYDFQQMLFLTLTIDKISQNIGEIFQQEIINNYYCDQCRQSSQMSKNSQFINNPKILILDLKRYKQDLLSNHYFIKDDTALPIFNEINLSQRLYNDQQLGRTYKKKDVIYTLKAIVDHYGQEYSGHYTCQTRQDKDWRKFDDIRVRELVQLKPNVIISGTSYILFYEHTR